MRLCESLALLTLNMKDPVIAEHQLNLAGGPEHSSIEKDGGAEAKTPSFEAKISWEGGLEKPPSTLNSHIDIPKSLDSETHLLKKSCFSSLSIVLPECLKISYEDILNALPIDPGECALSTLASNSML